MDLQKEREAFEKECRLLCYKGNMVMSNLGSFYNNEQTNWMWQMWLSAKAQAVPEGFVILKASDVREILSNASDAMDAESPSSVFTQTGIPSTWYDHHLVVEKNILDAIKAQEPTND